MSKINITTKENKVLGEKYYHFNHQSGLEVFVIPKNLSKSYAIFGTRYGSVDNKFKVNGKYDGQYIRVPDGIAHFLEHKLFENEDGEDTFVKYSRTGASGNAYTSHIYTCYLYSCTEKFYQSLDILLSTVRAPYFTDANVKKECGIIAQEIQMYEDYPDEALRHTLYDCLYENHEIRQKICGSIESINQITPEILYDCYNTFYNLHNMTLVVVGDVDVESTMSVCDKVLQAAPSIKIERDYGSESLDVKKPYALIKRSQVSQTKFVIGIKDIDIKTGAEHTRKNAIMEIMVDTLFTSAGKFSSAIYEEGLVPSPIYAYSSYCHSYSGVFVGGQSDNPQEIYDRYKVYIEEVKKNGVNRIDFERAKKKMYSALVRTFESSEDIGGSFIDLWFEGIDILDYPSIVADVTYEEVCEMVKSIFRESSTAFVVLEPLKGDEK